MDKDIKRDLGQQPMAKIMAELDLKSHNLVENSEDQLTHKMVSRGAKGRRLTFQVQIKILRALNKVSGKNYLLKDLFNY